MKTFTFETTSDKFQKAMEALEEAGDKRYGRQYDRR